MPAPTSPHPTPRVCLLRGCRVEVWPCVPFLRTVYPDGTNAPAAPEPTPEYAATTRRLGYGEDSWQQCLEHELSHSLLAEAWGLPASPTLMAVAHGWPMPRGSRKEEDAVLAFQSWCQGDAGALEHLKYDGWALPALEALRAELWRHARG